MAFIEVRDLKKTYRVSRREAGTKAALKSLFSREYEEVHALRGISFDIGEGELVCYIGPNGAGKSTTVKCLGGILVPDGGEARVGGRIPWKERKAHVARIGVVYGQRTQLWWDVPVIDSYELLRDIYRVPEREFRSRLSEMTDVLEIGGLLKTPLRQLSLGQRMRCELAGSLLHSPPLLFLDEPTLGLDAVSRLAVRDFLKKENASRGTTILLTTHDMEDILALCTRVMVLGHGRLLYDGSMQELLARYDTDRMADAEYADLAACPDLTGAEEAVRDSEGVYHIRYSLDKLSNETLLRRLQAAGDLRDLSLRSRSTEDLVARMYREMDL